jgi:5-methyltetrahydrofolate--homocysteine methyltransferase
MSSVLERLAHCVEMGKVNKNSKFPASMQSEDGADELAFQALQQSFSATEILQEGLMTGMKRIGDKFGEGKAFIPDMLISAKAMNTAMVHLKPFFESGELKSRGTVVIGTVSGDLHDIGKNIVGMVLKGDGWNVVDLGVDVSPDKFVKAIDQNPNCHVGLSALLTTTMINMKTTKEIIKNKYPDIKVFIGGAPISDTYNKEIGTDGCFSDPYRFTNYLKNLTINS